MKVEELIKQLQKMPQEADVYMYQRGGVFDCPIEKATQTDYDKRNNNNRVTIICR